MNVPVVSHLKLLVNLYNKMNNRFLVLLVIYLIIYLLSVLYKNKQIFCAILLSLLSWERGLKSGSDGGQKGWLCRSSRGSVDWNTESDLQPNWAFVAPLVGAWIEIQSGADKRTDAQSLLSWERGLKYKLTIVKFKGQWSRSSRGSVDWNIM